MYFNKFDALMSLYGVEEEREDSTRGWNPPLSFKQYLRLLLWRDFWGDEMVLFAVFLHVVYEDHSSQHEDDAGVQDST